MNPLSITHPLGAGLMIALPLGLIIYLTRRFKTGWALWCIGCLAFVVSQVGHIPFNIALSVMFERGWLPVPGDPWKLAFFAVVWGMSAGGWETLLRWVTYRWWAKEARSWRAGVLIGAGHGGVEAMILGTLSLLTFMRIASLEGIDLATIVPGEQLPLAQQQIAYYWSMDWYLPLLAPLERIFTMCFHITASVLVLQAFTRKQAAWGWAAFALHSLMDGVIAVYLAGIWRAYPWQPLALEGLLGLTAIINLSILFMLKQPEPEKQDEPPPPLPEVLTAENLKKIESTQVDIEDSRYTNQSSK